MIKWKELRKNDLFQLIESWTSEDAVQVDVPSEYQMLRDIMKGHHEEIKRELGIESVKGHEYQYDLRFGLKLYKCLNEQFNVTEYHASDDSLWIFLGVRIFPDIVFWRWGKQAHQRFYAHSRRIWLKVLWWYVHLSWQGDEESTFRILKSNSTDEIVQLVERSGPHGYRVELCREIMRQYGEQTSHYESRAMLFRRIMKLNTARLAVMEPALYEGQEKGYVRDLFYEVAKNQ